MINIKNLSCYHSFIDTLVDIFLIKLSDKIFKNPTTSKISQKKIFDK